jgi:hypothetical protein
MSFTASRQQHWGVDFGAMMFFFGSKMGALRGSI